MNYSLGNIISNGGAINPDGLALDLAFAADKTLTARRGPTPTFSRASTATFVGSNGLIQSAAINAPRFDHDPVTLASRGLLIEEQRTNTFSRSEEFSNAAWIKDLSTISANVATAPDGTLTADKLVEDATNSVHQTRQASIPATTNTSYTVSFFAKSAERSQIWLYLFTTTGSGFVRATYNLATGTILTAAAVVSGTNISNPSATITQFANGWYRCTLTATTGASATNIDAGIGLANAGATSYLGDGTSGALIWGAQFELGAFATSYIPTTTTALTRSADVCSITGADFTSFYNQSEGTIFAQVRNVSRSSSSGAPSVFAFSDGSISNAIAIQRATNTDVALSPIISSGNQQFDPNSFSSVFTDQNLKKLALAYKLNDMAFSASGLAPVVDTSGIIPTSINQASLGTFPSTSRHINGHIASLQYFRKRLPNAKLQSLTA